MAELLQKEKFFDPRKPFVSKRPETHEEWQARMGGEVLAVLRAHRLEPKRLAFVKNTPAAAPWLFLVEAQKNRKTGLNVEPDVLISAGSALYGEPKP